MYTSVASCSWLRCVCTKEKNTRKGCDCYNCCCRQVALGTIVVKSNHIRADVVIAWDMRSQNLGKAKSQRRKQLEDSLLPFDFDTFPMEKQTRFVVFVFGTKIVWYVPHFLVLLFVRKGVMLFGGLGHGFLLLYCHSVPRQIAQTIKFLKRGFLVPCQL
jgi:hypothetical protein